MTGVEFISGRANPQIDPHLSVWNWEIPGYLFLGGLVAGIMIIGSLFALKWSDRWESRLSFWSPLLALGFLSLGMLFLFLDLSHKLYVWRFYLAFKPSSPMSWGAWILVIAYPALALWFIGSLSKEQIKRFKERFSFVPLVDRLHSWAVSVKSPVYYVNIAVGAGLGIYTGILLHTLDARPLWSSGLLGPLFLASGVSAAAAFMMLLGVKEDTSKLLLKWDIGALAVELILIGLFIIDKASGNMVHQTAINLLLSGPYTGAFFGLVVLGGIISPLIIEVAELSGKVKHVVAAPALVLLGGISLRVILVAAGQISTYHF